MLESHAKAVYSILTSRMGADKEQRDAFVAAMTAPIPRKEYRLSPDPELTRDSGARLIYDPNKTRGRFWVDVPPENMTPTIKIQVKRANSALGYLESILESG